jgi:Zn-dependent protease
VKTMKRLQRGSFRLCQLAGIDLYLHWSWFLVAAYEIADRTTSYSSPSWNVLEYVALFLIVTLHEYGHALACRSVGGKANQIVLWPLGGVAYVQPPPRPGPFLWSISAGPLVNLVLWPILYGLWAMAGALGWQASMPNAYGLLHWLWYINVVLLVFNLLPVYPLDGGQMLRSLLWFRVGAARSLKMATIVGFVGVGGLVLVALWLRSPWFGIIAAFVLFSCWGGLRQAQRLARRANLPRREGFACPACKKSPPAGPFWVCAQCRKPFDTFQTQAVCPHCATQYKVTSCLDCGRPYPISEWAVPVLAGVPDLAT